MKPIEREPVCPLCGASNDCAMAAGDRSVADCWCIRAKLQPEVLARVPAEKQNRACVCQGCATGVVAKR